MSAEIKVEEMEYVAEEGGITKASKMHRERMYGYFLNWVNKEFKEGESFENLYQSQSGRERITDLISQYFFNLKVKDPRDGLEKPPKLRTSETHKSSIKCEMIKLYGIDFTNVYQFPHEKAKWNAFVNELIKQKRADSEQSTEVDPTTMGMIYEFLGIVEITLRSRGLDNYEELLSRIPAKYHDKLHEFMQSGVMLCLNQYEVRRSGEHFQNLRKADFRLIEDDAYNFKYIQKQEINKISNSRGVIPWIDLTANFNPARFFPINQPF